MILLLQKKKTTVLFSIIVVLFFLIFLLIFSGPLLIMELFYSGNIIPVDVELIDGLFVERTNKFIQISNLVLAGDKVTPCLLSEFIQLDMELNAKMQSCIVEEGFLVIKDKV